MALLPGWNKSQVPWAWLSATFWALPLSSSPTPFHPWPQCKSSTLPGMFSAAWGSDPKGPHCLRLHFLHLSAQKDLHCILFFLDQNQTNKTPFTHTVHLWISHKWSVHCSVMEAFCVVPQTSARQQKRTYSWNKYVNKLHQIECKECHRSSEEGPLTVWGSWREHHKISDTWVMWRFHKKFPRRNGGGVKYSLWKKTTHVKMKKNSFQTSWKCAIGVSVLAAEK